MNEEISYEKAGVDIDAADEMVDKIAQVIADTWGDEIAGQIGAFGGHYRPPWRSFEQPELVASTDSVGTKIRLAAQMEDFSGVGLDCTAMVLNDLIIERAQPLFFLDYIAADTLDHDDILQIVEGLAEGCRQAGCALIGGELAEMPGFYRKGDYELVGFGVGITEGCEESRPRSPREGDVLVGLASTGVHSNGYSLIRHLIDLHGWELNCKPSGMEDTLGEVLLHPTRIYVSALSRMFEEETALAAAHITGGGLLGNIPRVLPDDLSPRLDWSSWEIPPIFHFIGH